MSPPGARDPPRQQGDAEAPEVHETQATRRADLRVVWGSRMTINGEVGESMILNVIHETDDEGRPTVVVHFPAFNVVGSGIDIFDALLSLAQEIVDIRPHFADEPDEKLAPDALRLKRRLVEWF